MTNRRFSAYQGVYTTITHSCGHRMTYNEAYGAAIPQSRACPSCAIAADLLPDLMGSDKQIRWATDIRSQIMDSVQNALNGDAERPNVGLIAFARIALWSVPFSEWWIDNRFGRDCEPDNRYRIAANTMITMIMPKDSVGVYWVPFGTKPYADIQQRYRAIVEDCEPYILTEWIVSTVQSFEPEVFKKGRGK